MCLEKKGVSMNQGYEIIQINENTWRIEDSGVRFFLLAGKERAALIDSGMTVRNAKEIAEGLTDLPLVLLNTHADPDHIGSNGEFASFYMHPDEEDNYRGHGGKGVLLPVLEGDILDLGGRELEVIELPGHTPGSIAWLDSQTKALISGDPIQNGRIFMFGPHRNLENYVKSLEHLAAFHGRYREIWPSHSTFPAEKGTEEAVYGYAKQILSGEARGVETEFRGGRILVYEFEKATLLCDVK